MSFVDHEQPIQHPKTLTSQPAIKGVTPAPAHPAAGPPSVTTQRVLDERLNGSPSVRARLREQRAQDGSPRVTALARLSAAISDRRVTPQPRQPLQRRADPEGGGPGDGKAGATAPPVQRQENRTGLPDGLKAGVQRLSGVSLDDVRVHYDSPRPAQLQALAYASGTEIHVAPGQEGHLPHEAWHVVQQKQGRVRPTLRLRNMAVNDDAGLEREADVMGARALSAPATRGAPPVTQRIALGGVVQRAAPVPVTEGETAFLSLYQDPDTHVQFKKLGANRFMLNGRIIEWDGVKYTTRAGEPVDLAQANDVAEPDADVLDVTQGEIGLLADAGGVLKKIRSTSASPCVIATIHDTETRKTMMAHIHRKNKVDTFVSTAAEKFGAWSQNLQVNLSTLTYENDNVERQEEERSRQQIILDNLKARLLNTFEWLIDEEIVVDKQNDSAMIDAATGVVTHPLDSSVDGDRAMIGGKRGMGIESGWGQQAADNSQDFAPVRTANVMPGDEAVFQYKRVAGPASLPPREAARAETGAPAGVVQPRWTEASETLLAWDRVDDGLQWFYDRTTGKMRFTIANAERAGNDESLRQAEGGDRTYDQWLKAGWLHEQDPEMWKEAGWDLETPIAVAIMDQSLHLTRGGVYVVGVDHREQGPFVEAMEALRQPDVTFLFEGHDSSQNQTLPEQTFGLEGRYEKLAVEATFAARFIDRFLRSKNMEEFTEYSDRVVPYTNIALEAVTVDEQLSKKMVEIYGPGIGGSIVSALATMQQLRAGGNEDILKVLLAIAHASTALVAEAVMDQEEREDFLDEHVFAANFKPSVFYTRATSKKDWMKQNPMKKLNEFREAAMARNIRNASSPANAVVVCVGALHMASLLDHLGSRAKGYEGAGAFFSQNHD